MNTNTIEQLLRKAPQPPTPAGLINDLNADIALPRAPEREVRENSFWLRRWLPALGFAVWFLGCIVVLGVQSSRVAELKQRARTNELAANELRTRAAATANQSAAMTTELESLRKDLADLARLRAEVERLRDETAELSKLQAENAELRRSAKVVAAPPVKPEEDFFAQKERAQRTVCVNRLKQFCLAARLWANASKTDAMPRDTESVKQHGDEKMLVCPSTTTPYQILSPGASEARPNLVFVRCPTHNLAGLVDGSVHGFDGDVNVVQRNGEWVLERIAR